MTQPRHRTDEECTVGCDGCCTVCGVSHGAPCLECGGRGFHRERCSKVEESEETVAIDVSARAHRSLLAIAEARGITLEEAAELVLGEFARKATAS